MDFFLVFFFFFVKNDLFALISDLVYDVEIVNDLCYLLTPS